MQTDGNWLGQKGAVEAFLNILRGRRTRRFGLGMAMGAGPMAYRSRHVGLPLTEEEEALLAFAACGVTGPALADLIFERGQGGTILAGLLGRTIAGGDAIHTVALIVMNREATYYLKRPQDFDPAEVPSLIALAAQGAYVELYRRSRMKLREGRPSPPLEPIFNINCNRWSLYDPAGTYFLPVNELTLMYLNGVLEIFDETTAAFVVDERAGFQPAGVGRFARSKGGHLRDDPRDDRVITIQQLEGLVTEFVTIEQGMMLQNLALMVQAMGLGGFPHWAAHPFGWFEALGFRMGQMRASRYLGINRALAAVAGALGRDQVVPYVLGLEHDGKPLLTPFCPPYYPTMEAAVRAVVDRKFGPGGTFRGGVVQGAWRDPQAIANASPAPSEAAVTATIAFAEYVYRRYGRFPAYAPPLRTLLGFQVNHLDVEFYDTFYRPEALTEAQRQHLHRWHGE